MLQEYYSSGELKIILVEWYWMSVLFKGRKMREEKIKDVVCMRVGYPHRRRGIDWRSKEGVQ